SRTRAGLKVGSVSRRPPARPTTAAGPPTSRTVTAEPSPRAAKRSTAGSRIALTSQPRRRRLPVTAHRKDLDAPHALELLCKAPDPARGEADPRPGLGCAQAGRPPACYTCAKARRNYATSPITAPPARRNGAGCPPDAGTRGWNAGAGARGACWGETEL